MSILTDLAVEVASQLVRKGVEAAKGAALGWLEGWRFGHMTPQDRYTEVMARLEAQRLEWQAELDRRKGK